MKFCVQIITVWITEAVLYTSTVDDLNGAAEGLRVFCSGYKFEQATGTDC